MSAPLRLTESLTKMVTGMHYATPHVLVTIGSGTDDSQIYAVSTLGRVQLGEVRVKKDIYGYKVNVYWSIVPEIAAETIDELLQQICYLLSHYMLRQLANLLSEGEVRVLSSAGYTSPEIRARVCKELWGYEG